ncbi:MAG: sodium:proton antiporter, partial [Clostridia bacterium]|nr:sodium:proton antiporter [Clostridia bacterium]
MAAAFVSYAIGRRDKRARDSFVIGACLAELAVVVMALLGVLRGEAYVLDIPYFCGMGLHFELDGFRALYALVGGVMWLATSMLSREYFAHHYHNRNRYYMFFLMTLGATLGVFLSSDLFTTFIFFEIMSFTSYTWVAHDETPGALRAAETYLAVAIIGGMVMLVGLFVLYMQLGTLTISELHHAAEACQSRGALWAASLCILCGFGAKAGMFPMHIWLPKAHPVAPAPASALLSGILTKSGIFGIIVVSANIFRESKAWGNMLLVLALITMLGGAVLAVFSVNLKRTLACSSMSQIGFILTGIAMSCLLGHHNALAARGALLYMVNHSLFKLILFMAAGVVYMNL